jgi:alpha-ketoglutarate-dependent taurine dioxygenase
MSLSVKKSGAALGAEIAFDLARDMDEGQFREIEAAFHDNIVVVFRGQTLPNARHIEFSRRFGELEIHIVKKYCRTTLRSCVSPTSATRTAS